jgi:alcohol dehydrogenase class IV
MGVGNGTSTFPLKVSSPSLLFLCRRPFLAPVRLWLSSFLLRGFVRKMTESTDHPLSGCWKPTQLQALYYSSNSVKEHLISCLPSTSSKAFIITGSSLAQKTSLVKQVEELLGKGHHAGTFANIKQHAPVAQLDEATNAVSQDSTIDTLISIGGGSPIDSAKAISYRVHEKAGKFLFHIAIPTTLSAAECAFNAGYTRDDGTKSGVADPKLAPQVIIYDSQFGLQTPQKLWLSTGIRALDHAVELLYHPTATEVPAKQLVLTALGSLFKYLPKCKDDPKNEDYISKLQLAAFSSLYPLGTNVKGGIGLSHTIGYALGSPYGIPHGITSCISLAGVVRLKASNPAEAEQIARALPFTGTGPRSGDDKEDALKVGDAIEELVNGLGLGTRLSEYGVGEDQIAKIAKTATKAESGELYDGVVRLVKSKL